VGNTSEFFHIEIVLPMYIAHFILPHALIWGKKHNTIPLQGGYLAFTIYLSGSDGGHIDNDNKFLDMAIIYSWKDNTLES
jgi:hypothetical protein